jgi:hypothetical protein
MIHTTKCVWGFLRAVCLMGLVSNVFSARWVDRAV